MQKIKINTIKEGIIEDVYDIEVEDAHHYILENGIISHNSGPKYNSSIILEFSKAQEKDSSGKVSGALITSKTDKCRTAKEKTKVKFSIDFENGLNLYSGLQLFCEDEKIFVKEKSSFKLNPEKTNVILSIGEVFSKNQINADFWEELLEKYLAEYLHKKFKYQSLVEEITEENENV